MTIRTKVTEKGIEQDSGSGFDIKHDGGNEGFTPYKLDIGRALVSGSSTTLPTVGGYYTLSGDREDTFTMPTAASTAGSMFIIRTLSVHSHSLTASGESAGTKAFCMGGETTVTTGTNGSALTLPKYVNASVVLFSDGASFVVVGGSGSITLSGL